MLRLFLSYMCFAKLIDTHSHTRICINRHMDTHAHRHTGAWLEN